MDPIFYIQIVPAMTRGYNNNEFSANEAYPVFAINQEKNLFLVVDNNEFFQWVGIGICMIDKNPIIYDSFIYAIKAEINDTEAKPTRNYIDIGYIKGLKAALKILDIETN